MSNFAWAKFILLAKFMPVYIAAKSNNPLNALTQCLELENFFMYYTAISVDFILQTSRHDENCFISLKSDSH